MNTSKNPLSFDEFDKFCYWLEGKFGAWVPTHAWTVVQLGINVDLHEMHLDGIKSLKLTNWRNAWFQMYQKGQDLVRVESHMMPNLEMKDALAVMRSFVTSVEQSASYIPGCVDKGDYSYS